MAPRPDPDRVRTVLLLLVPGAAAVYLAFRGGGAAAGVAALVAVACLAALLVRARPGTPDAHVASRIAEGAILALPGLLTLYFAFNAGGFFPETPAFVAIALALILVVRVTTAADPFAGFSWSLGIATAALGLFCVWILLSASWSESTSRALVEFDRALVYLLALVLFGSLPRRSDALRWMVRGLALAIVAVAAAGFVTRTLPDVFPTELGLARDRLGWPLTYWNTLGILGSLGAVLSFHLAASLREPLAIRATAAAALPVLAATVLLTFSRGAILAGFIGLITYALLGRPRGLATAVLATVPLGALAVKLAYDATLLASNEPTSAAATDEGHELALAVAACCAGAGALRIALVLVDRRLARLTVPPRATRAAWAAGAVVVMIVALAADAPGRLERQYDRFVETSTIEGDGAIRDRLTSPSNTGRIDHWDVALDGFGEAALRGTGAGTYGLYWMAHRPESNALVVDDAHSLYIEVLAELGLVGTFLLVATVGAILIGFAPVRRGRSRTLYAALAAAGLAWAIHAGIDWDWETPAVTVWFFCLGGAALAARARESAGGPRPSSGVRVVLGALLLTCALAPALVFVSQRQLDDAAEAFDRGDCAEATERASAAIRTLEIRPEPYEVLGFCDVRRGFDRLGVDAIEQAVERDPDNWEYHYALAIVRGSAGIDPRPAARRAFELNPTDPLTKSLVGYVDSDDPRRWIARTRPIAENERLSVVR